jgi:WD40 repeat protein
VASSAGVGGMHRGAVLLSGLLLTLGCVRARESSPVLAPAAPEVTVLPQGATLEARTGHMRVVTAVAVSPDGRRLVSGSTDGMVRVWDAHTGRELMVLPGRERGVTAVSVSSDDGLIAAANWDHTVSVWELETGRLVRRFDGHAGGAAGRGARRTGFRDSGTFATFLPRNRIVSAAHGELLVWEARTGQRLRRIVGHEDGVTALAASLDGRWVVSAGADQTIRMWSADTGAELRTFYTGSRGVRSLGLSADGRWVVSGGRHEPVRIWDVASDGYDGSPGIEQRLRLRREGETYDVARYRSTLNRPDVVRASLAGALSAATGDDERRCASGILPG